VQTTLLGLAIAAILALVAALVGPAYVDWGQYRPWFEAEASRMAAQPVRIAGTIDVRLLPTPKIMLHDVEIGPRAAPAFGAQAVQAELSLGSLVRGDLRASLLTLTGPEIGFALGRDGHIVTHFHAPAVDTERVAIDRLVIDDGRLSLEDDASGRRATLENFTFDGEARVQAGLIKGEGAFTVDGQTTRYRLTTGRREAGTRVRLALDPADRPLAFETDGTLTFESDGPVYEGTASLARPAGVVLESGKAVASEPWRISGKVRADARHALFEQVEAQYGPDERRLRLGGTGEFRFGAQPKLEAVLSARQLDLDRALASANLPSRLPLSALASIVQGIGDAGHPPFALSVGIGIDAVTFGGANLQALRADIKSEGSTWNVETFEFRAPGATQVQFSGRLGGAQNAAAVAGPLRIDSADPGALMAWLEGADRPRNWLGSLRLRSDIDVGPERVAFERVSAEVDRRTFEGRFAYNYPSGTKRAKLDVGLNAAEFDIEAAYSFVKTAMAGSKLEPPGEVALAVDLGRTSFAGVAAVGVNANLRYDSSGVRIEQLAVADFGGAAVAASGQIDIASPQPAGNISLSLTAPKIDGVAAVLDKMLPGSAETMLRHAARLSPARVDAVLSLVAPPGTLSDSKPAIGKFSLDGRLGVMRLALSGEANGIVAEPAKSNLHVDARIASEDGALLTVLGLDRFAPADRGAANFVLSASGPLDGNMRIDARVGAEGFDLSGAGTLKVSDWSPTGTLDVALSSSDVVALRRNGVAAFPVALKSRVKVSGGALDFTALAGKAGGASVKGQLALAIASKQPWNVDGKVSIETLDVPSLIAALVGAPPPATASASSTAWPPQPFASTLYSDLRGRVEIEAARAMVLPTIGAQKLQGAIKFGPNGIGFDQMTAIVGGGKASANARLERGPNGITLRGNVALAPADATALIRAGVQKPVTGRVSGEAVFESAGSSPAALVAGLRGGGLISLDSGKVAGVSQKAIDAAAHTFERGPVPTAQRVAEIVTQALDGGALAVPSASAPLEIANGRIRLGKPVTPIGANIDLSGSLDAVEETVDLRFTLDGSGAADAHGLRPELVVNVKGPLSSPQRVVDVSALTSWLTLRSVERESRRLEAEEREAKRRAALDALIREATREQAPPITGATASPAANAAATAGTAAPAMSGNAAVNSSASNASASGSSPAAAPGLWPPVSGLFAPELPAPQWIPSNPRSSAAPPGSSLPPAAALATTPPTVSAPVPTVPSSPVADDPDTSQGMLPVNPPLPQRRPSANASPVELAPPRRSRFDTLLTPQ